MSEGRKRTRQANQRPSATNTPYAPRRRRHFQFWSDGEIKSLVDTLLTEHNSMEHRQKAHILRLAHAKIFREHGTTRELPLLYKKYYSLEKGYRALVTKERKAQQACVAANKPITLHEPQLPFFMELNLVFGKPSDLDLFEIPDHPPAIGADLMERADGGFKQEDNASNEQKTEGGCELGLEVNSNLIARSKATTPTIQPVQAVQLASAMVTKTERCISILMEEYAGIMDEQEMNAAIGIIEDDKKAAIFLAITITKFRDSWLQSQLTTRQGL